MDISKIYLDMDGVLADFNRGVKELCGMEPLDQQTATDEETDRLWEAISQVDHYYDRLEQLPGAADLLLTLIRKYGDRCEVLTAIPKPKRNVKNANTDKKKWMERHFGSDIKVNIVFRAEKKNFCTGEDSILIDDYQANIDEWVSYGGTGILFTDAATVMQRLKELGIL